MSHDHLTYDDLLRIVELIKSSEQFSEFRLKIGEIEIELRRRQHPERGENASSDLSASGREATVAASASAIAPRVGSAGVKQAATPPAGSVSSMEHASGVGERPSSAAPAWPPDAILVRAPMVGTFYRSPEPGAPPFVEVGQRVEPETTVCIIEVMKLMNSIAAGAHGVVMQVLVDDATAVETNAPLIVLAPAPVS